MIEKVTRLLDYISLPRYWIRRQLTSFAAVVGRCHCILDVGSGELTPYEDLFDHETYLCIDLFARANVKADAAFLPFASKQADLVLCTEVLEHLPNPGQALDEMCRVLVPGGFLIVTVPLAWGEHDHVDYQRWTEAGLRKMLQSTGFEIKAFKRRGGVFVLLGCMIATVPYLVFGPWYEQRNWLLRVAYVPCWLMTIPISWFFSLFDHIDQKKAFTFGYNVLCQKSKTCGNISAA